jgi:hypothetical protein
MQSKLLKIGMMFCLGAFATQLVWAQPDPNVAPKADNPPEKVRGNRGPRPDFRAQMEQRLREMLAHVGVNDAPTQDAVVAFLQADTQARRPLREQNTKLFQALNNGGVTDDQLLALVTDLRAAQDAEKVRREKAQADLDAKIHYTQNPRLEAVLMLAGLIGDGQNTPMFLGGGDRGDRGRQGGQGDDPQRREQMKQKMLQRFDANKDGQLDDAEKAVMHEQMQKRREQRQQGQGAPGNAAPPPPAPAPNGAMPEADDA